MKIHTVTTTYENLLRRPAAKRIRPKRPDLFFRSLVRALSQIGMAGIDFTAVKGDMKGVKRNEPCLILMNHSCFLDMQIAAKLLYPRPYTIVTTTDGFVGKKWIMRQIGCMPTQKFVSDLHLIRDMSCMLHKKRTSVLMFPEAGYSFDGRATVLPRRMGQLLKMLKVPVVFIKTEGAFLRTPLYNELKNRKVPIRAEMKCLLTVEEIAERSVEELDAVLADAFSFDQFQSQYETGLRVTEEFRADGLERVLYKCPHCGREDSMRGEGIYLTCHACGRRWELTELGRMRALEGETEYAHIPDWFDWQRDCVKRELEEGTYRLDTAVDIGVIVDTKALYMVGTGRLTHDAQGFCLVGDDGVLRYEQKPKFSYSLNSDYYWYEIGDMIGIGTADRLFYCFPREKVPVAKVRLATEELFKIAMTAR